MRLLIPLLLLCYAPVAQSALFADNEAREEIVKLRKYVKEQQDPRIADLQAKLATLEKRLAQQETNTVNLVSQIDQLNAEIGKLRGQLEMANHQLQLSQQRQRDLYGDLDGRLRKLESSALAAPAAAPPANADAATSGELKSYEAAHELFKGGKYAESAQAFGQLIQTYPNGKYAPNAYYWMGYAQFSHKDYAAAVASQQKLMQLYPNDPKVPDAMYNLANSQIQLNDFEGAKKTLRALLTQYPTSEAAPLAKKRLGVLESLKTK